MPCGLYKHKISKYVSRFLVFHDRNSEIRHSWFKKCSIFFTFRDTKREKNVRLKFYISAKITYPFGIVLILVSSSVIV